jgi:hypothetical protein
MIEPSSQKRLDSQECVCVQVIGRKLAGIGIGIGSAGTKVATEGIVMSGRRSADQGFIFGAARVVGAVMSSAF